MDNVPLANTTLSLHSNNYARFHGYAMTDSEGSFTFMGIPKGKYYIKPTNDRWATLTRINVIDTDIDLGVIGNNFVNFAVIVEPHEDWDQIQGVSAAFVSYTPGVQKDESDRQNRIWRFDNLLPGQHTLGIRNKEGARFTTTINVTEDLAEPVIIAPPKLDASLSGHYYRSNSQQTLPQYLSLRNMDNTFSVYLVPQRDGSPNVNGEFEIKVPAGQYKISYKDDKDQKLLKEFEISSGQNLALEIDLDKTIE